MSGDVQITGAFQKRPIISASPRTINLGVLENDITSPPRVVTIRNKGSAPLIISSSEITGTNAHELEQANGCTNPLSHDATCTIIVTATPISSGKKAADLVIHSNDTKKPSFRIKLRAKAK
jgi:hypothetical protein